MKKEFKNVYVVMNYGIWCRLFYNFKDAKKFVEEGMQEGKFIHQIYKCDVELKDGIEKIYENSVWKFKK